MNERVVLYDHDCRSLTLSQPSANLSGEILSIALQTVFTKGMDAIVRKVGLKSGVEA